MNRIQQCAGAVDVNDRILNNWLRNCKSIVSTDIEALYTTVCCHCYEDPTLACHQPCETLHDFFKLTFCKEELQLRFVAIMFEVWRQIMKSSRDKMGGTEENLIEAYKIITGEDAAKCEGLLN